jgi:hypothetical protein
MHSGTVLFFHLFDRMNFAAEVGQLGKFLLNCLQPLVSLAVSDLSFRTIATLKTILLVRILNLCDLDPETPNLFPKNP